MLIYDNRRWFGPNGYPSFRKHCKTGSEGKWRCADKAESSFGDEISPDWGIWDNFRTIAIVFWLCQYIQGLIPTTFKVISDDHDCLHPRLAANRGYIGLSPVWIQTKVKSSNNLHHIAVPKIEYLLLSRSRSGVGVGVGVDIFRPESESEPESIKIRRLRSPG